MKRIATLLLVGFAFLLASFAAHNSDWWRHLSAGRYWTQKLFTRGDSQPPDQVENAPAGVRPPSGIVFDVGAYAVYSLVGGTGSVLFKAILVACIVPLLLGLCRTGADWLIATLCVALAVLTLGTRIRLEPATISYFMLALTLWLLWRPQDTEDSRVALANWALPLIFVLWVNLDSWFLLGLGTVALVWLGRALDSRKRPGAFFPFRHLFLLVAVCVANPLLLDAFTLLPRTLTAPDPGLSDAYHVPEHVTVGRTPAGAAYYALFLLSLLSFAANRSGWRWQRFLPWLGLALLSTWNAAAIPFFAVFAGPVLGWNMQELCERHAATIGSEPRVPLRLCFAGLTFGLLLLGVVLAWPGWLQEAPFGPRQWTIVVPSAAPRGAAAIRNWHAEGKLNANSRGLHLSLQTRDVFAWLCQEDLGVTLADLGPELPGHTSSSQDWNARLHSAGVTHVIVYPADQQPAHPLIAALFADPQSWPLLFQNGSLAIFGLRVPSDRGTDDPFRGWSLDFYRLAFHPAPEQRAPPEGPGEPAAARSWSASFWHPAKPVLALDSEQAFFHLLQARACQQAELQGSLPAHDSVPALLHLSIRAARRGLTDNPQDARACLALGESYLRLLQLPQARSWSRRLPELAALRQVQACLALNIAHSLDPDNHDVCLDLAWLYQDIGYLSLARKFLERYQKLPPKGGGQPTESRGEKELVASLSRMLNDRSSREADHTGELMKLNWASLELQQALQRNDQATLQSYLARFGREGLAKALEFQLKTARLENALFWLEDEKALTQVVLGQARFRHLRLQALAAMGNYALAKEECRQLVLEGQEREPPHRDKLTVLVGQAVLDGAALVRGALVQPVSLFVESHLGPRAQEIAEKLAERADATVLRGVLALEEGDVEEAEISFRLALLTWRDAAAAATGAGLDFKARPIAQDYLAWISRAGK
jgi:tetratricopeptide (TPR) repeat protein